MVRLFTNLSNRETICKMSRKLILKRGDRMSLTMMLLFPPLSSILDRLFPSTLREGTFTCPRGEVQGRISVPASSHVLVEQTSALCHCRDCTTFVEACCGAAKNEQHNVQTENGATHMVNLTNLTFASPRPKTRFEPSNSGKGRRCDEPLAYRVGRP
eukprot:scaffold1562_cov170-Amphora_coffeaeformis.AAC.2